MAPWGNDTVHAVGYVPDGKRVAVAYAKQVHICDAGSLASVRVHMWRLADASHHYAFARHTQEVCGSCRSRGRGAVQTCTALRPRISSNGSKSWSLCKRVWPFIRQNVAIRQSIVLRTVRPRARSLR